MFKVGDIVKSKSGRIGNGIHGIVKIGPDNELYVIDNENNHKICLKNCEHLFTVINNINIDQKESMRLLYQHYSCELDIENLRDFYIKYENDIDKSFNEYISDMIGIVKYKIKYDAFISILLKTLKEKYPDFIFINDNIFDNSETIRINVYNIPDEIYDRKINNTLQSIENELYEISNSFIKHEFDVLFFTNSVSTTKKYYNHILKKYNKEN